jgi:hypothetical protein
MTLQELNWNLVQLVGDLDESREMLAALPDDQEWTLNQLDTLDCLRRASLDLAREAEAIIDTLQGRA